MPTVDRIKNELLKGWTLFNGAFYSFVATLVTNARFNLLWSSSLNLLADSKTPIFTTWMVTTRRFSLWWNAAEHWFVLFIVSHFWFHLCRHNLRPLLRSHALTWAWSLLRTCSVINLMNKHHIVISFIQSTDSDIFGLTVWRDAEGTCFYWVLCQICPLAAVMAAFY